MIIVYNAMGAIVAIAGLVIAAIAAMCTELLSVAFVALAAVWCWFGRSKDSGPAPAICFIPLCYWGVLAGILVFPAISMDISKSKETTVQAPYAIQLEADEKGLETNDTDEPEVSASIRELLAEYASEHDVNVRIKSSAEAMLILVEVDTLKEISDRDRKFILQEISALADAQRPGVKVFTGIKGRFMYGAVSTPDGYDEVGGAVREARLHDFYKATPEDDAAATKVVSDIESEDPASDTQTAR